MKTFRVTLRIGDRDYALAQENNGQGLVLLKKDTVGKVEASYRIGRNFSCTCPGAQKGYNCKHARSLRALVDMIGAAVLGIENA